MNLNFLDFEQPIAELEAKIQELRLIGSDSRLNIAEEIVRLERQSEHLTASIFAHLKPTQVVQLARHPNRPYFLDYVERLFTDFDELFGDRSCAQGTAIVGGLARLNGMPVMVIGHQKGRKTAEKVSRNFGMPRPEEYRKALRLAKMAERFKLPLFTFVDTPGAYPGLEAEEYNQSEAIARNLQEFSKLKTPIICTITGEGGSGGALAIAVADRVGMLQYSIYSVISPEGCASILWKSTDRVQEATEALRLTSSELYRMGLIDYIIDEPLGGAHRRLDEMANRLKATLVDQLSTLQSLSTTELLAQRYERLMSYGRQG